MNDKLNSKGMMRDIMSQRKFALQLIDRGKDYDDLLKAILKEDYYYDEDFNYFPLAKDILAETDISYSVFKRKLSKIYRDLQDIYRNRIDYSINNVEYIFSLSFLDNYAQVKLQNIPCVPRVGEDVSIPYFKEKVHTDRFYVRSINHEFSDKKQTVHVNLVVGQYNLYWNLLKDEEYAKGKMSRDDYSSTRESRIREKYKLRWL